MHHQASGDWQNGRSVVDEGIMPHESGTQHTYKRGRLLGINALAL